MSTLEAHHTPRWKRCSPSEQLSDLILPHSWPWWPSYLSCSCPTLSCSNFLPSCSSFLPSCSRGYSFFSCLVVAPLVLGFLWETWVPFLWIEGRLSLQFASYCPFILCSIFSGTFSYFSTYSFSFPPSSSFRSIPDCLFKFRKASLSMSKKLSMCSQGLCKGTLLPIIKFRALRISNYGKRRSASYWWIRWRMICQVQNKFILPS